MARCKAECSEIGEEALDWESVVDFPHGSFRMLGSRKSKHMDKDPSWVGDKAYYPVVWQQETGSWVPIRIHYNLLRLTSIYAEIDQIKTFETSAMFRDISYQDVDAYKLRLEERRRKRMGISTSDVKTEKVVVKP